MVARVTPTSVFILFTPTSLEPPFVSNLAFVLRAVPVRGEGGKQQRQGASSGHGDLRSPCQQLARAVFAVPRASSVPPTTLLGSEARRVRFEPPPGGTSAVQSCRSPLLYCAAISGDAIPSACHTNLPNIHSRHLGCGRVPPELGPGEVTPVGSPRWSLPWRRESLGLPG